MKVYQVHDAQSIQSMPVRIVLVSAKIKGFCIWMVDFILTYLQSDMSLIRIIIITNPAPEFELSFEENLELIEPIYDLAESEDVVYQTLDDRVQIGLKMTPTIIDSSSYC